MATTLILKMTTVQLTMSLEKLEITSKRNVTDSYDEWDKSYFSLNKTNNQTNKTKVF